jgi:integrase
MRIKAPKPARTFLEMDELVALIDAAGEQDGPLVPALDASRERLDGTRAKVARAVTQGMRSKDIAAALGLSKATVSYHLVRLGVEAPREYQGRRAICGTLARSGIRASELCDLRVGEVRLHDPDGARFRIPDAKTEAGVREVQMSPELVEEFVSHFDRLRRAGRRTDPDAYAFPNTRGGRIARQRVARVVGEAATRASERVSERGLPPLPHTTPHTLRRTDISIALLANRFDVLWVMGQVGHADSKMTLDVYAQLQQRVKREHGRAFDTLVRQAREQLYGTTSGLPEPTSGPNLGHESGHEATSGESDASRDERIGEQESSDLQADRGVARPGLEPGTPRFSGVCDVGGVRVARQDLLPRGVAKRACPDLIGDDRSGRAASVRPRAIGPRPAPASVKRQQRRADCSYPCLAGVPAEPAARGRDRHSTSHLALGSTPRTTCSDYGASWTGRRRPR